MHPIWLSRTGDGIVRGSYELEYFFAEYFEKIIVIESLHKT